MLISKGLCSSRILFLLEMIWFEEKGRGAYMCFVKSGFGGDWFWENWSTGGFVSKSRAFALAVSAASWIYACTVTPLTLLSSCIEFILFRLMGSRLWEIVEVVVWCWPSCSIFARLTACVRVRFVWCCDCGFGLLAVLLFFMPLQCLSCYVFVVFSSDSDTS